MKSYLNKSSTPVTTCLLFALVFLFSGCYNDKQEILYPGSTTAPDCATVPSKFAADIYPLITSKCAIPDCHDATASGGNTFQNYSQISSKKDRINVRVIMEKSMPPAGALLPDEINKIKCWINNGALNN